METGRQMVASHNRSDDIIPTLMLDDIKNRLCAKTNGDPLKCFDCSAKCAYGRRAIELLEFQTRSSAKMSKREMNNTHKKIEAMKNYVEAVSQPDPTDFVLKKYNCDSEKSAKNKIYQWQHNYGTNMRMIESRIKMLEDQIEASEDEYDTETEPVKILKVDPAPVNAGILAAEEKKQERITRKKEANISKTFLEKSRAELEQEILDLDDKIAEYTKAIEGFKMKQEEDATQIQAIRQVLEMFKKKESETYDCAGVTS